MPQRQAHTEFGGVVYETVECASCEEEIPKQAADRFVTGDVKEKRDWRAIGKIEYNFDPSTLREGWVCEYCAYEGPIGYPERAIRGVGVKATLAITFVVGTVVGALLGAGGVA